MKESPVFKFRGDELINFIWKVYSLTRISEAIKDMPELEEESDPMQDQDAQDTLIREWIDELIALPVRDDGTVIFEKQPWIVNVGSNIESAPATSTK